MNRLKYEEKILREIQFLPDEDLPRFLRMVSLFRSEFFNNSQLKGNGIKENHKLDHYKTRKLLSSSKGNWAESIIKDQEDRL